MIYIIILILIYINIIYTIEFKWYFKSMKSEIQRHASGIRFAK